MVPAHASVIVDDSTCTCYSGSCSFVLRAWSSTWTGEMASIGALLGHLFSVECHGLRLADVLGTSRYIDSKGD